MKSVSGARTPSTRRDDPALHCGRRFLRDLLHLPTVMRRRRAFQDELDDSHHSARACAPITNMTAPDVMTGGNELTAPDSD